MNQVLLAPVNDFSSLHLFIFKEIDVYISINEYPTWIQSDLPFPEISILPYINNTNDHSEPLKRASVKRSIDFFVHII